MAVAPLITNPATNRTSQNRIHHNVRLPARSTGEAFCTSVQRQTLESFPEVGKQRLGCDGEFTVLAVVSCFPQAVLARFPAQGRLREKRGVASGRCPDVSPYSPQ